MRQVFLKIESGAFFEVSPLNANLSYTVKRVRRGVYEKNIDGGVTLHKADFTTLYNDLLINGDCRKLTIEVRRGATVEFTGVTNYRFGRWNIRACSVTFEVPEDDSITRLDSLLEIESNVLVDNTKHNIWLNYAAISPALSKFETEITSETVNIGFLINPPFVVTKNAADGWRVLRQDRTVADNGTAGITATQKTWWIREIALSPTNAFITNAISGFRPDSTATLRVRNFTPILRKDLGSETVYEFTAAGNNNWSYNGWVRLYAFTNLYNSFKAVTLKSAFERILSGTGFSIVSDTLKINPVGTFPAATNAVQILGDAVFIAQTEDIKNPTAATGSTVLNATFSSIVQALRVAYNCDYRIEGNTIRIEHKIYFEPTDTGNDYSDSAPNEFAFINNRYSSEKWGYQTGQVGDSKFKDALINYREPFFAPSGTVTNCVAAMGGGTSVISQMTPNIGQMLANPTLFAADNKEYCIFEALYCNGQYMVEMRGTAYNTQAIPTIQFPEQGWDMQFAAYSGLGAQTVAPHRRYKDFEVRNCAFEDIDFYVRHLGATWGEIETAAYDTKKGVLKITLVK